MHISIINFGYFLVITSAFLVVVVVGTLNDNQINSNQEKTSLSNESLVKNENNLNEQLNSNNDDNLNYGQDMINPNFTKDDNIKIDKIDQEKEIVNFNLSVPNLAIDDNPNETIPIETNSNFFNLNNIPFIIIGTVAAIAFVGGIGYCINVFRKKRIKSGKSASNKLQPITNNNLLKDSKFTTNRYIDTKEKELFSRTPTNLQEYQDKLILTVVILAVLMCLFLAFYKTRSCCGVRYMKINSTNRRKHKLTRKNYSKNVSCELNKPMGHNKPPSSCGANNNNSGFGNENNGMNNYSYYEGDINHVSTQHRNQTPAQLEKIIIKTIQSELEMFKSRTIPSITVEERQFLGNMSLDRGLTKSKPVIKFTLDLRDRVKPKNHEIITKKSKDVTAGSTGVKKRKSKKHKIKTKTTRNKPRINRNWRQKSSSQ